MKMRHIKKVVSAPELSCQNRYRLCPVLLHYLLRPCSFWHHDEEHLVAELPPKCGQAALRLLHGLAAFAPKSFIRPTLSLSCGMLASELWLLLYLKRLWAYLAILSISWDKDIFSKTPTNWTVVRWASVNMPLDYTALKCCLTNKEFDSLLCVKARLEAVSLWAASQSARNGPPSF